ncbi:2,3-butanediol dehydrogenase [Bombilactobacillus bombi]|uniref:2,3-butanediol dehydrogenase n=1 Tax=Bombilactobacillus bombi TaxID=1303590 RepID=UPI0015E5B631|nr:2,3-butanediol dehydrogenase [Bombilactobacillus bombi]MBA1434687.1 2,3-butanediol dehydrogenase [Bombilactobacillus bombi]
MKAVRIYGKQDIRVEDIDIAEPKADQVQIKVKYCGICGSDLHAYSQGFGLPLHKHPLTGRQVPITLGHEFSGEIVKLGKDVTDFKIGDAVAVEPLIACGHCANCRSGNYNLCLNMHAKDGANFLGYSDDGGMAEYVNAKANFTYKLPKNMDYELGALTEPTAVAYEAIKKSGLMAGQTVAVMGAGPIGLLTALLAQTMNATKVYISDLSEERLSKAQEFGLTTLNPAKVDVNDEIKKELPMGVDVTFECAGAQPTLNTALQITRRGGIIQIVAIFGKPVTIDLSAATMQGYNINTVLAYNNSFPLVMGMINNHQALFKKLITNKLGFDQAIEGIKSLASDKSQVKIMILPEL